MYKCKKHTQTHIQVEQTHTITYECVCCSMMQCVAARTDHDSRATNSPLKRECCSMLQCIAACCSELQRVPTKRVGRPLGITKECVAVGCSELQCTLTNRVEPPLDIVNTVANIFSQSPSLSVCLSLSRACFCSLVSSVPPSSKETMEFVGVSRTAIQMSSLSPSRSRSRSSSCYRSRSAIRSHSCSLFIYTNEQYGVATISRLLKIISLICKISSLS